MVSRRFASRLPVLSVVVAAHLGALLLLVMLTHTQRVPRVEEEPLLVMLLAPAASAPTVRPLPTRRDGTSPHPANAVQPQLRAPLAPAESGESPTIDWAAEAHAAAEAQLEEDERARRRDGAFGPQHSGAFASSKRTPEFHWDHARTHRVEPLSGGIGVAVHLNDHCALVLFWLIPMVGCTVGKIPVRGDLFEHMRDPPEVGASP